MHYNTFFSSFCCAFNPVTVIAGGNSLNKSYQFTDWKYVWNSRHFSKTNSNAIFNYFFFARFIENREWKRKTKMISFSIVSLASKLNQKRSKQFIFNVAFNELYFNKRKIDVVNPRCCWFFNSLTVKQYIFFKVEWLLNWSNVLCH